MRCQYVGAEGQDPFLEPMDRLHVNITEPSLSQTWRSLLSAV